MIELDGSQGGGQLVRTALGLSILTQRSFRIKNIRSLRPQPGLKAQHCSAIKACAELSNAYVEGATIGSLTLEFIPRDIKNRQMVITTGTAASTSLILQSLMIPSLFLQTTITVKGGTDVPWSMPASYLTMILLPILKDYADTVEVQIGSRGYYPKGGGSLTLSTKPKFRRIDFDSFSKFHQYIFGNPSINLSVLGSLVSIRGISHASQDLQDQHIAERQARFSELQLQSYAPAVIQQEYSSTPSTGNGLVLVATYQRENAGKHFSYRLGCDVLGSQLLRPESVAENACKVMKEYIEKSVCVDQNLQDSIIPYLGLFGGRILTGKLTNHTLSNIDVCKQFLDVDYIIEPVTTYSYKGNEKKKEEPYSNANCISVLSSSKS